MQRPDIVAVMQGQARPTEEEGGEEEETDGSTAPLLTPGLLYTAVSTPSQRQAAFDRANMDLNAPYLVIDKAVALLVATHAYDERGTCGNGLTGRRL